MSRSRDLGDVGSKANFLDTVSTDLGDFSGQSIPHIIPDVLYPAVEGKDLAGVAFSGSYVYGTAHTDNRKYYYTDIKGSKPIKDPRIGGHFGSQRYKFKSIQLLEQETATHGKDVYSIDGREWCRVVGSANTAMTNNDHGYYLNLDATGDFIEITGYFNNFNTIVFTHSTRADDVSVKINGGTSRDNDIIAGKTSVLSPLISRYVDSASVINHGDTNVTSDLGTTPKINTLKLELTNISSEQFLAFGIELIAQDTTSTANRSKIQIPSQNVVSYGKKFTVSGTPHYDPFSAKTDGSAWTSPTSGTNNANSSASWPTNIDTATSLGLDKWVDGSNYYRPYNGGRVVKWVDSSGTIKTSVTVMPPNAKSIKSADVNKKAKNDPNDTYLPTFEDETTDVNEDQLHEVAKTFHFREFGNGSANGGTGSSSYPDASMISTADSIAYVMDDGLTSLSGTMGQYNSGYNLGANHAPYVTFIGTGITISEAYWDAITVGTATLAQNLPYGTHVIKFLRDGSNNLIITLDGVEIYNVQQGLGHQVEEITFHQPKKPPIPEDACVIADYMLMADFVKQGAEGLGNISKGVRTVSATRDVLYEQSAGTSLINALDIQSPMGFVVYKNGLSGTVKGELPYFGTAFVVGAYDASARAVPTEYINSTSLGTITYTGSTYTEFATTQNTPVLGLNGIRASGTTDAGYAKFDIATPIHTSSHYQSFETPFLHELVGGDRNMEQTNLVCSPDGKTWDEVTRDTSYIGNIRLHASEDGQNADPIILTDFRGVHRTNGNYYQKNFAIAYDRFICLKAGQYEIKFTTYNNTTTTHSIKINGTAIQSTAMGNTSYTVSNATTADAVVSLNRGDYVQISGKWYNQEMSHFSITEV